MAEYKQIRLNPDVRELLDAYKMNGESYSIAIGRLFKENQSLMADKDCLMKIAMNSNLDFLFKNKDLMTALEVKYLKDNPEKSFNDIFENIILDLFYTKGYYTLGNDGIEWTDKEISARLDSESEKNSSQ